MTACTILIYKIMSGHSKWAQIKRQKGVADQKKGQVFTKLSNAITLAVKQGGGVVDPSQNFKLRLAMDAAKIQNMPRDNIERAIKRAISRESGELEEVIYEGFAPEGISVIIQATTDNPMRTTSQVKSIFSKAGGTFGQPGSVAYQFIQLGEIVLDKANINFDDIFALAVDSGAEDMQEAEDVIFVYTKPSDLAKVRTVLMSNNLIIKDVGLIRKPINLVHLTDQEKIDKVVNFLDQLEEMDDIQKIYSNLG